MTKYSEMLGPMLTMHRLYTLADYPVIEAFIRRKSNTGALKLDGRSIQGFVRATAKDIVVLSEKDRSLLVALGVEIT